MSNFNDYICPSLTFNSFLMFYINQVIASFNYDENVVTTTFFVRDMDDESTLYTKVVPMDKTDEQMQSYTKTWSLTTLSISTGVDVPDLINKFGKSFKRCYVRFKSNNVFHDYHKKEIRTDGKILVSLDADFSAPLEFHLHNDSPMPEDFMKTLELNSVVGFTKS